MFFSSFSSGFYMHIHILVSLHMQQIFIHLLSKETVSDNDNSLRILLLWFLYVKEKKNPSKTENVLERQEYAHNF